MRKNTVRYDKKVLFLSIAIALLLAATAFGAIFNYAGSNSTTQTQHPSANFASNVSPIANILGTGLQVNPFSTYSSEPAPMGIADYGIGSNGSPYYYNTTSFLGGVNINSLSTNNASSDQEMTFQFNVNLAFVDGTTLYVYWVQDVAFVNTSSHQIFFIDNVWNMSTSSANVLGSTLSGNGTIGNSSGTSFYYDYAGSSLPGNNVFLTYPSNIQLMMNSTVTASGVPEVVFMYNDGSGWVTYDNVLFTFVSDLTGDFGFVVSGYTYEPNGFNPYDAELTLGGPGGGSSTVDVQSNVNLTLQYWNGHNFQEISNAYNFGIHTAETISNVISGSYYYIANGSLFESVTSGAGGLEQVYTSSDISLLNISTTLPSGILYVNGTAHLFVGGNVNLTLAPGTYQLKIYSGSLLYKELNVTLSAGQYLPMDITESLVTFTETGLPSGTGWWVNLTGHSYFSTTSSILFYEPNQTYSYSLSTLDKNYKPIIEFGTFAVIGQPVSQSPVFEAVLYNITLTETGLPSETTWTVSLGGTSHASATSSVSFDRMNGSYKFSVSNLSLYYTLNYTMSITVNGRNVSENVEFLHYAYITGTISPDNATLTVNGKVVSTSGGKFNISVIGGNYSIIASSSGYNSYYANLSVSAGNVKNIDISLRSNAAPASSDLGYIGIGIVAVAIVGIGAFILMRRKKI